MKLETLLLALLCAPALCVVTACEKTVEDGDGTTVEEVADDAADEAEEVAEEAAEDVHVHEEGDEH